MTRIFQILIAVVFLFALSAQANATLLLRGQGTSVHGTYNLIYDTSLNVTWYDYTHNSGYMTRYYQGVWAAGLNVDFGGTTYTDWRLPTSTQCIGYNCTGSEMGSLYYTGLGNVAGSGGFANTGDFQHLMTSRPYWSGTGLSTNPGWYSFGLQFSTGYQTYHYTGGWGNFFYALAVRSGDVTVAAVPEPSTMLLLGSGIFGIGGLGFIRRRFKV